MYRSITVKTFNETKRERWQYKGCGGEETMLCPRRLSTIPLTVLTAILVLIIFVTKQAKDLYERNQKYHRMENYNQFISEVSSSMSVLKSSTNKTSDALRQLMDVLHQHHHRARNSR